MAISPETIAEKPAKPTLPSSQDRRRPDDDDAYISDMDYFARALAGLVKNGKSVRPDLISSIIAYYATNWLPELSGNSNSSAAAVGGSPESATTSWAKKRFLIESLVGILPPPDEKGSASLCDSLLRLLRAANMVGAAPACRAEIERRASACLEQASLEELMIPAFNHTCRTLLDIQLVHRLVQGFLAVDHSARSGSALIRVAKLIDSYLAEAAIDGNMKLEEFLALAGALPSHARASDDGLYRAVDTYLKLHPSTSKQERRAICRLLDVRKLSPEAAVHAAQNERLPVRTGIRVLLSEQHRKMRQRPNGTGGPSLGEVLRSPNPAPETPSRCFSGRELVAELQEVQKLREEVARLERRCGSMQAQIEKLLVKKSFFRWRKLGGHLLFFRPAGVADGIEEGSGSVEVAGQERPTPREKGKPVYGRRTPSRWRNSVS